MSFHPNRYNSNDLIQARKWCQNLMKTNSMYGVLEVDMLINVLKENTVKSMLLSETQSKQFAQNQILNKSIQQIGKLIYLVIYTPHINHNLRSCRNIVGFYEIIKHFIHNEQLNLPYFLKSVIKNKYFQQMLGKVLIEHYREIVNDNQDNELIKQFRRQLNQIIKQRIAQFESTFNVNLGEFGECLMEQHLKIKNQQQYSSSGTIDWVILSSIYLVLRLKEPNVLFGKVCDIYQGLTNIQLKREQLLIFYNKQFLKVYGKNQWVKKASKIQLTRPLSKEIVCQVKHDEEDILDI